MRRMISLWIIVMMTLLGQSYNLQENPTGKSLSKDGESYSMTTQVKQVALRFVKETLQNVKNFGDKVLSRSNITVEEQEQNRKNGGTDSYKSKPELSSASSMVNKSEFRTSSIDEGTRHTDQYKKSSGLAKSSDRNKLPPNYLLQDILQRIDNLNTTMWTVENEHRKKQPDSVTQSRLGIRTGIDLKNWIPTILFVCTAVLLIVSLCGWMTFEAAMKDKYNEQEESVRRLLDMIEKNHADLSKEFDCSVVFLKNTITQTERDIEQDNFVVHEIVERVEGLKHIIYSKHGEMTEVKEYVNGRIQNLAEGMNDSKESLLKLMEEFEEKLGELEKMANELHDKKNKEIESLQLVEKRQHEDEH